MKECVYCGAEATTVDHVIARCLLEKPYPPNLKTLPSCRPCNEAYAKDEEYFLAVLAQSGCAPSLESKVAEGGVVDRMLTRHPALDQHFQDIMKVSEDGKVYICPDEGRIGKVALKAAFGLFIHRYKPYSSPKPAHFFVLKPMPDGHPDNFVFAMAHNERFRLRRWTHMQTANIAGRRTQVCDYMFVRNWLFTDFGRLFCLLRFHETIWVAVRCPNPPMKKLRNRRFGVIEASQSLLFGK